MLGLDSNLGSGLDLLHDYWDFPSHGFLYFHLMLPEVLRIAVEADGEIAEDFDPLVATQSLPIPRTVTFSLQ